MKEKGVLVFALLAFSVPALGAFTPVLQSGEPNHAQILGSIYGDGTPFIGQGDNLGNGAWSEFVSPNSLLIARRVHDFVENVPVPTDQVWTCSADVFAKAKYAGLNQSFGWNQGGVSGGNYEELLNEGDIGNLVGVPVESPGEYLWGIKPSCYKFWSKQSENIDQKDHMVTYRIESYRPSVSDLIPRSDSAVWLLFFEDLPSFRCKSDWDYNDFVIEVNCVPEPTTIMLLGFGTMGLLRRKRST